MESLLPGLDAVPHLHPLFVHFPIVLWLAALLFWGLAAFRNSDSLFRLGRWLLYLGTAGAAVAVTTGLIAADQLGHESPGHDLVHTHRDFMLIAAGIGLAVTAVAFLLRRRTSQAVRWLLIGGLLATNAVTVLGADRGALLVFGYGIGSAELEPPESSHHHHDGDDDDHHGEEVLRPIRLHRHAGRPGVEQMSTPLSNSAQPGAGRRHAVPCQLARHGREAVGAELAAICLGGRSLRPGGPQ